MSFIEEFKERGYFYQCTNEAALTALTQEKKIIAYIGFDCTARSLHVGNLMQIMILRLLQQYGHKPVILVGGATTKIGDPTDKEELRKYLDDQAIEQNMQGIKESLAKFIKFGDGAADAIMVNNADWLEQIGYIEFLREMGRNFSVNRMLTMDSVRLRLEREQSLSFLEFNYMLLQAYDFYYLNKSYNCQLQLGGSDQWGNIVAGIDLVRKVRKQEVFGLTTPLLTTSSGAKMGKSVNGAIWLNETELSVYDYYQYWRNIEDADVIKFAKLYCEFSKEELAEFKQLAINNINEAKKKLAHQVTTICHGQKKADQALAASTKLFEQGVVSREMPHIIMKKAEFEQNINILELFVKANLAQTKSEVRRLIRGGGAKFNDQLVINETMMIKLEELANDEIKLSAGKKKHILVKLV